MARLARRALAVPGDLPLAEAVRRAHEAEAGSLDQVFLYNIDDLQGIVHAQADGSILGFGAIALTSLFGFAFSWIQAFIGLSVIGELWWWITNGVAGTQMPAWRDAISESDRWSVLNYIVKSFAAPPR